MSKKVKRFPPMKPKVKVKWVATLRSGKYKQARGVMADGVGFCCLGVLANVCSRKSARSMLGYSTPAGYGIDTVKSYGFDGSVTDALVGLNDSQERSFKQIALWIERNL